MINLIRQKLESYKVTDIETEKQALKEILQSITLYALWRVDFFEIAAFQGGTSLRILHALPRFSEDLDFIVKTPDPTFTWEAYSQNLLDVLAEYNVACQFVHRPDDTRPVKEAFIKDDSITSQLEFSFMDTGRRGLLKVKLEVDTNPPIGSNWDYRFLDFPLDFEVCTQDLSSNFALKLHALLCRPYVKGRDWFDFGWYCRFQVKPNMVLLENAINQYGPWKNKDEKINEVWLLNKLAERIRAINWNEAVLDVTPFVAPIERPSLKLWSQGFFLEKLATLEQTLESPR